MNYFLTSLMIVSLCDAFKILVIFPIPGKSHVSLGNGLVKLLLEAGHEVTFFTPYPTSDPHSNLEQIDISSEFSTYGYDINRFINSDDTVSSFNHSLQSSFEFVKKMMVHENVQKFVNDSSRKFDVVIAEWLFNDLLSGFAAIYDCPHIWLCPLDPFWLILNVIDEFPNPAYIPDIISRNMPPFNFVQRVSELWHQIKSKLFKDFIFNQADNKAYLDLIAPLIAKKRKPVPSYEQVRYNVSLILGNSHPTVGLPTKLPLNYKPVGGFHINKNVTPLPENIQKLMDNATNGVIYFSLGTNVKSKDMPEEIKRGLLKTFEGLKQTVIWKYEEPMPDVPKNVHVLQWTPQQSILAHSNCILFITHCGLLSMTEAVHFGVPVIGVPVFVDQFLNINRAVSRGIGRRVDLTFNLAEDLKVAVEDVLSNPRYTEKIKEFSLAYHHRPVSPGAELVHWVEHVVLTRGAPHLRSPALLVPWYQKMYLDLIALIIVIVYVLKSILRIVLNKCKVMKKVKSL